MIDYLVSFLSRYLYAILFSAIVSSSTLVGIKLVSKRVYKKRTIILISSLFGSFLIALFISSVCFAHWFTISYGELYHVACNDVSFSYIRAICTIWVTLMSAAFSFAFLCGTVNYYFGERIATWLYHIKPLSESRAENLYKILNSLAQKAYIKVPKIGLIECSTPLIFSIGRQKKSTIVLSVGLLETLSSNEIEASFAHEVSHIKNNDCLIKSLASSLKFAVPFNFLGYLIEPAICRDREFLADEESVKMTKKPEALISTLIKLYESFAIIPNNRIFAGLSIRPFALESGKWSIFSRHPPITERLKRLLELENTMMAHIHKKTCLKPAEMP